MIHIIDLHFQGVKNAIAAFLVETTAGPVLIETGPHSTFTPLKKGIESKGFSLSDIKHVFLSHIHFDHAGAAWAFAELGAKIYVHPSGAPHLHDPSRLLSSAKRIYQDKMDVLWGAIKPIDLEQMQITEHGSSFQIGDQSFTAWHTPGHAIHHIAWQMGDVVFTGDVGGVSIKKGVVIPPCPPPDINIEDWMESIRLLRALKPGALYLTHFGKVENISQHLDALEKCLWDWANWMRPYAESDASIAEVSPKFQQYVGKQLMNYGIGEEGIRQYETANPSWMSVAGLIRYWKKKAKV